MKTSRSPQPGPLAQRLSQVQSADLTQATPEGQERLQRQALREATSFSRQLKRNGQASDRDLVTLAGLFQKAGLFRESLKVLQRVLKRSPRDLRAHFLAARAHQARGHFEAASDTYRLLTQWAPRWATPFLQLGRCAAALERPLQAQDHLEAYLARKPEDQATRRRLARSYLTHRRPVQALQHLETLVQGDASVEDLEGLSLAYQALRRSSEAVATLDEAFRKAPGVERIALRLARLRLSRGEAERAFEVASQVVAQNPNCFAGLELSAKAALELGDHDRSLPALERLVKLDPDNIDLRLSLAEGLYASGDRSRCRHHFERLVDRFPKDVRAATRLAEIETKEGNRARARQLFGRVLASDPGHPLALLRVGEMALEDGDPKGALVPLRRLVMARPENPRAHRRLGEALRKAGRLPKAREHLERSLELAPTDPETALELGHAHRDATAWMAAKESYERVLEVAPGTATATLAAYELSHLGGNSGTKEANDPAPSLAPVIPLSRVKPELGIVAPAANWRRIA